MSDSKSMKQKYLELFEELTDVVNYGGELKYQKDMETYYFVFELVLDGILEPLCGKDDPKYAVNYFQFFYEHGIGKIDLNAGKRGGKKNSRDLTPVFFYKPQ